jgi:hypothetical protein
MKKLLYLSLALLVLTACDDRYRYFCQDPKNFTAPRCQKPNCQFTQDCPEYLVAPVLEKKNERIEPASNPVPNN